MDMVKGKEVHSAAETEHSPPKSTVVADVSPGHIAGKQDFVRIVWANGDVKHRSAAAGSNDERGLCANWREQESDKCGCSENRNYFRF